MLVTRGVYSFVELSVSPVFGRQWSSIYEARPAKPPRGSVDAVVYRTTSSNRTNQLAGDHTSSRLEARTLKERTYEHQAQPMSGSNP